MTLDANDLGLGFHEGIGSGKLFRQLSVFNCQQRELHPYVQEEGRGDCFQSMLEGLPMRVPSPLGTNLRQSTIDHHPPQEPTKDHRMTRWTKSRLRVQLVSQRYIQQDSLLNSSQPRTQPRLSSSIHEQPISLVCIGVNDTGIDRMDITNV